MKYQRVIRAVCAQPWAIDPARLGDIVDVLVFQAAGGKLSAEEIREYVGQSRTKAVPESPKSVAVLPLHGIISHRINMMDDISGPGGTSTQQFATAFRGAMRNPDVGAVLIDVDSPGGSVSGVEELATEIHDARGTKPIYAIANTAAASAAYWIASQADEFSVTPSGQVGSIGVYAAHSDISEKLAAEGERVTLVSAGPKKVDGNPFEPLSEEARADIQDAVEQTYRRFVSAVAVGRGVAVETVEQDYGQGRTMTAQDALNAGMVDRIETDSQMMSRIRLAVRGRSGVSARVLRSPAEFAFTDFSTPSRYR